MSLVDLHQMNKYTCSTVKHLCVAQIITDIVNEDINHCL